MPDAKPKTHAGCIIDEAALFRLPASMKIEACTRFRNLDTPPQLQSHKKCAQATELAAERKK
jgi:hypothetical protein